MENNHLAKKILIIEDDKFLRDLASSKLKREGFDTLSAQNANEGFGILTKTKADLILLDIILPGIDGFEVLRRLKSDNALKTIPVILLSNLGQEKDVERGLKLGAAEYIIKAHYTLDEIIEKIKNVLSRT